MFSNIENKFEKIGAKCEISIIADTTKAFSPQASPIRLDVIEKNGEEYFEVAVRANDADNIDLSVLEVRAKDRHLVLLARHLDENGKAISKDHFLCGHDERHLFVASVEAVSTVAQAMASLKPQAIRVRETGLKTKKRNRRKNKNFVRQGEWFFVPAKVDPHPNRIYKNEPLVRGRGSKPHIAQFAFRQGGEAVKVCRAYPNGLTHKQYKALIERNPKARNFAWRDMQRNAAVFVKGTVRHPDHATIMLNSWHNVLMNTERPTRGVVVAFLD
ncbi:MAG: hypothetical protein K8F91_13305 [Candidatus Obscuribacterales bacterium]|nr:hypothetical protein [Candidatus Obscuribacterales bacterium]